MQLLVVVLPTWASEQIPFPGLKVPVLDVVNVTLPVGNEAPVPDASETVAVQVVLLFAVTGDVQLAAVLVVRLLTVRLKVPELAWWLPDA